MPEVSNHQNLEAHYANVSKADKTKNRIASAPQTLPAVHLYNDQDANIRMNAINNDIYQASQKEKKHELFDFLKFMGVFFVLVLGIKGIKHLFKKS